METIYLCIVIFLFVLAVFDLVVGVSNDAVNFLQSAVGAKAASFKTILFIAGIGVFIGAALSNGMIWTCPARLQPEHFCFCRNPCIPASPSCSPTLSCWTYSIQWECHHSTTISLVFELLERNLRPPSSKSAQRDTLGLGDASNTDKAAFRKIMWRYSYHGNRLFFSMLVQWLARVIFTFNYTKKMKYSIALFRGIAAASIIYFIAHIRRDSSFMTPENKQWIQDNTWMLISVFFVFLHHINADASLAENQCIQDSNAHGCLRPRLACRQRPCELHRRSPCRLLLFMDFTTNSTGNPDGFLMTSLLGLPNSPWYFLIGGAAS